MRNLFRSSNKTFLIWSLENKMLHTYYGTVPNDTSVIGKLVYNVNDEPYFFSKGDKVGQLVCRPVVYCDYVETLGEERASGAFGSTGVK